MKRFHVNNRSAALRDITLHTTYLSIVIGRIKKSSKLQNWHNLLLGVANGADIKMVYHEYTSTYLKHGYESHVHHMFVSHGCHPLI